MEAVLAPVIGALFAAGFYMLLRRSLIRLIIGLILMGQAANLLLFTMGRMVRGRPPLVPPESAAPALPVADPLPQALILTAIVISFGFQAFALILLRRVIQAIGSEEVDRLDRSEE